MAALLLLIAPAPAVADTSPFFAAEQSRLQLLLAKAERRGERAMTIAAQAQQARRAAQSEGNREAEQIAEQAVADAEQALAKSRAQQQRLRERLANLERAMQAGNSAGVSLRHSGMVERMQGGRWQQLPAGAAVGPGDELRAGRGSEAELLFADGSRVILGSDTSFRVGELGEQRASFELLRGRIHSWFTCLKGRGQCGERLYRHRGCFGAVLGTEFVLAGSEDGVTTLSVLEGEVELHHARRDRPVLVPAGQRASMSGDGEVVRLLPFDANEFRAEREP